MQVVRDKTGQTGVHIGDTHVGHACSQWNVCLFGKDTIRIQLGDPVAVKALRNIGNNKICD